MDDLALAEHLLCDRAYNGGDIETFHIPVRLDGGELVCDYKKDEVGQQTSFVDGDIILVDGAWYVKYMPQDLIDATKNYHVALQDLPGDRQRKKLSKEERQALNARLKELKTNYLAQLESRGEYRLNPHGLPDADGYQRVHVPKARLHGV